MLRECATQTHCCNLRYFLGKAENFISVSHFHLVPLRRLNVWPWRGGRVVTNVARMCNTNTLL